MFQSLEEIKANSAIGDSIPHSTVLHFLFSKASLELRPPHVVSVLVVFLNIRLFEKLSTVKDQILSRQFKNKLRLKVLISVFFTNCNKRFVTD